MKKQAEKALMIGLCIFFIIFVFTEITWATYTFYIIEEPQEKTGWCWVACARGLAAQEGVVTASQADAVKKIKGKVANVGGSVEDIVAAAEFFAPGKNFVAEYRQLSFDEIVALIDAGHIISASCGYFLGNYRMGGHSVLITGYNSDNDEQVIRYYDPLTAETVNISYEYFCERPSNGKILIYQQSVYYSENEVEVATATELTTQTEEYSQIFDMKSFIFECLGIISGCIAVIFLRKLILDRKNKR